MEQITRRALLTGVLGLASVAASAELTVALSGCAPEAEGRVLNFDTDEETEPRRLTFVGNKAGTFNLLAMENTLHEYLDAHRDVVITYEGIKGDPYWTALDRRRATGHLDDLFMIDHDRVIEMGPEGDLLDLSGVKGLANFTEDARTQFTNPDGSVWLVPTCISAYGLYCNSTLLAEKDVKPPTTWQELLAACETLGCAEGRPIVCNNSASLRSLVLAATLLPVYQRPDAADVIRAYNDDVPGLCALFRPGLARVRELLDRGYVDGAEVLVTEQTADDLELFCSGERPFMAAASWMSPRASGDAPEMTFTIVAHPMADDGPVLVTDVNNCIAVNAASEYTSDALSFMEHLCNPDVVWDFCETQTSFSPIEGETRTLADETLAPCMETLAAGRVVIASDYRLTVPVDTALRKACASLCSGATVNEAEAVLQATLEGR